MKLEYLSKFDGILFKISVKNGLINRKLDDVELSKGFKLSKFKGLFCFDEEEEDDDDDDDDDDEEEDDEDTEQDDDECDEFVNGDDDNELGSFIFK
jgi:ABC-type Zn2+ transport system substrate-binding protein/surface adhesin